MRMEWGKQTVTEVAQKKTIIDLNGSYHHKVDVKGRVALPSVYRKALPTDLVVTPNPQNACLQVFTQEGFNDWVEGVFEDKFGKYDRSSLTHQNLRRALKARTLDVSVDTAGRITLPADQRELVGISKDVTVSGGTGFFEIWDAKRFVEQNKTVNIAELFKD